MQRLTGLLLFSGWLVMRTTGLLNAGILLRKLRAHPALSFLSVLLGRQGNGRCLKAGRFCSQRCRQGTTVRKTGSISALCSKRSWIFRKTGRILPIMLRKVPNLRYGRTGVGVSQIVLLVLPLHPLESAISGPGLVPNPSAGVAAALLYIRSHASSLASMSNRSSSHICSISELSFWK